MFTALPMAVTVIFLCANLHAYLSYSYAITTTENRSIEEHCSAEVGNRSSSTTALQLLVLRPFGELASPRYSDNKPYHHSAGTSRENRAVAVAILSALELATEQINNRSDILPCNKLELVHIETDCESTTETLLGLTSVLFPPETLSTSGAKERAAVVGAVIEPNCPRLSLQVSAITNRPEIQMVVLHNSDSILLADRETYPYSLGILGSTQPFAGPSEDFAKWSSSLSIRWMRADACAKFLATTPPNYLTTPTFSGARRRNVDTAQRKRGNLRSSSKFAIAIVLTKQTMGVTVIIRVIIQGSKVTVQEKVGRLKPPQPPRF